MNSDGMKSAKTFVELFDTILVGNKEDSRKAARAVRKFLYSSQSGGEFEGIRSIINNAPEEYRNIIEDWREENFVIAVSVLYFLHDKEKQRDFLFPWILFLLQHQNGNIRQSAVRMLNNELGPLTFHIRCPEYEHNKIKSKQYDFILINLFISLNKLLDISWKPIYKKYKYISSLPTSPFKSIQMVLSCMEDSCGKEYMELLKKEVAKRGSGPDNG